MNLFTKQSLTVIKTNLWLPKRNVKGRDKSGAWDEHTHTTIYKIDNQQGPTIHHRKYESIFCDNLYKNLKKKECMYRCITGSPDCLPRTNTAL